MATPEPKRLYQVWKGSNRFLCGGRLIFGPKVGSLYVSSLLIMGPVIAFCYRLVAKILANEHFIWLPVLVVAVFTTALVLISLFLTSSRDPGIIPRNKRLPEGEEAIDLITPSLEWVSGRAPDLRLPRTKSVSVNGIVVKVKFCDTCLLYRPPRASHCSICDNCVQRFDHHCPWVGQCIGLRNYRFFFLFISSSTFLCIYVFTFSILTIILCNESLTASLSKEIVSVVLIIYCFIGVWFVGGLTAFHLYLMSRNQTTYENFRNRYEKGPNAHNKGISRNFKEMLCSRIPSSLNDFRSWVPEDHFESSSVTPRTISSLCSPSNKFDIEIGSRKFENGAAIPLPALLQHLEYDDFEDYVKSKDEGADGSFVPFWLPLNQELTTDSNKDCATTLFSHKLKNSPQACTDENATEASYVDGRRCNSDGGTLDEHDSDNHQE